MKYVLKSELHEATPHPESNNYYYSALGTTDVHMTVVEQHPGTSRSGGGPLYSIYFMLAGSLRITDAEGNVFDTKPGDAFFFDAWEEKTTANITDQDAVFLLIGPGGGPGAPGAKPPMMPKPE